MLLAIVVGNSNITLGVFDGDRLRMRAKVSAEAERSAALLRDGCDDGTLSATLCAYAVAWVLQNPQVLPPLAADYRR